MSAIVQHQIVRTRKVAFFQVMGEFGVTQEVQDVLAVIVRPAQPEQLLRQAVTPKNGPFFGGQNDGIWQRLRPAAKAFDQASQLATALFITHLHLVQAVQQRFPAAASWRWRHAAIDPQPPGKTQ
ncbi:hypothetical protein D3C85_1511750 [compost metagenome]